MSEIVKVPFHGDELLASQDAEGRVWVVLKRMCEALGVHETTQARKLKDKAWATTVMMTAVAEDGKNRDVFALDIECVPMWLATIEPKRVSEACREKLVSYQRECARVLRDHFFAARSPATLALPSNDNHRPAQEAFEIAQRALISCGTSAAMAAASVIADVEIHYGVTLANLRKALPRLEKPRADLNATSLGALIGVSAIEANKRLHAYGLQTKNAQGEWALTDAGKAHGEAHEFLRHMANGGKRAGMQVLWFASAADVIREAP